MAYLTSENIICFIGFCFHRYRNQILLHTLCCIVLLSFSKLAAKAVHNWHFWMTVFNCALIIMYFILVHFSLREKSLFISMGATRVLFVGGAIKFSSELTFSHVWLFLLNFTKTSAFVFYYECYLLHFQFVFNPGGRCLVVPPLPTSVLEISVLSEWGCVCPCVHPFNFWTSWLVFTKLGMKVMPLVAIPVPCFLSSCK